MTDRIFKIVDREGYFSHGILNKQWRSNEYYVNWSKAGKTWKTEKGIKDHLLKCLLHNISLEGWQVVEVVYTPTVPMTEWVDQKMLMKTLKGK